MTAKEAMRIIEQRHLTAPEAYQVVHALFEAEKREAELEKLCDDGAGGLREKLLTLADRFADCGANHQAQDLRALVRTTSPAGNSSK